MNLLLLPIFPPSSHSIVVFFVPVGLLFLLQHSQQVVFTYYRANNNNNNNNIIIKFVMMKIRSLLIALSAVMRIARLRTPTREYCGLQLLNRHVDFGIKIS